MFVNLAQIAQGAERIRPVRLDEDVTEVEVTLSAAQLAQREAYVRAAHAAIEGEAAPRRVRAQQAAVATTALWDAVLASVAPQVRQAWRQADAQLSEAELALAEAELAVQLHNDQRPGTVSAVPLWAEKGQRLEKEVQELTRLTAEARRLYEVAAEALRAAMQETLARRCEQAQQAWDAAQAERERLRQEGERLVHEAGMQRATVQQLAERLRVEGIGVFEGDDVR